MATAANEERVLGPRPDANVEEHESVMRRRAAAALLTQKVVDIMIKRFEEAERREREWDECAPKVCFAVCGLLAACLVMTVFVSFS